MRRHCLTMNLVRSPAPGTAHLNAKDLTRAAGTRKQLFNGSPDEESFDEYFKASAKKKTDGACSPDWLQSCSPDWLQGFPLRTNS